MYTFRFFGGKIETIDQERHSFIYDLLQEKMLHSPERRSVFTRITFVELKNNVNKIQKKEQLISGRPQHIQLLNTEKQEQAKIPFASISHSLASQSLASQPSKPNLSAAQKSNFLQTIKDFPKSNNLASMSLNNNNPGASRDTSTSNDNIEHTKTTNQKNIIPLPEKSTHKLALDISQPKDEKRKRISSKKQEESFIEKIFPGHTFFASPQNNLVHSFSSKDASHLEEIPLAKTSSFSSPSSPSAVARTNNNNTVKKKSRKGSVILPQEDHPSSMKSQTVPSNPCKDHIFVPFSRVQSSHGIELVKASSSVDVHVKKKSSLRRTAPEPLVLSPYFLIPIIDITLVNLKLNKTQEQVISPKKTDFFSKLDNDENNYLHFLIKERGKNDKNYNSDLFTEIKFLLDAPINVNVNTSDISGNYPLHTATINGDLEIVKLLTPSITKNNASYDKTFIDVFNKKGETPLICAIQQNKKDIFTHLLSLHEQSNDYNLIEKMYDDYLFPSNKAEYTRNSIKVGIDEYTIVINHYEKWRSIFAQTCTIRIHSSQNNTTERIIHPEFEQHRSLIVKVAGPIRPHYDEKTILNLIYRIYKEETSSSLLYKDHEEVINNYKLWKNFKDKNASYITDPYCSDNKDGFSPLYYAIMQEDTFFLKVLSQTGVKPYRVIGGNVKLEDMLHALKHGCLAKLEIIKNHLNKEDRDILVHASLASIEDITKNNKNKQLDSLTSIKNYVTLIKECTTPSLDITFKNKQGNTFLHRIMCLPEDKDIVCILEEIFPLCSSKKMKTTALNSPSHMGIQNTLGQTPFHFAAQSDHLQTTRFLCEKTNNFKSNTPWIEKINVKKTFFNQRDNEGNTPLICAAEKGHFDVVNYFFTIDGIDVNARNKAGKTAADYILNETKNTKGIRKGECVHTLGQLLKHKDFVAPQGPNFCEIIEMIRNILRQTDGFTQRLTIHSADNNQTIGFSM